MTLTKKQFSETKPIQLLFYVPDRMISSNDKLLYIYLYKHLAERREYFFVDNSFALDQALLENRKSIYAVLRDKCDLDKIAPLCQMVYASDSVQNEFCFAKYAAVLRYETHKIPWIIDVNCLRLPLNKIEAVVPDHAINLIFHYIENEMLIYNSYINGFETTKI
jgi:hypothetical protein